MSEKGLKYNMSQLCTLYNLTRQAYYKHMKKIQTIEISEDIVVNLVRKIRKRHPLMGVKKLYHILRPELQKFPLKIGRDKLFDILRKHNLLNTHKKKYVKTTDSNHQYYKYDNILKELDMNVIEPDQVIVSDITYLSTNDRFYYLSLVTDVGSRKITGYNLSDTLKFDGSLKALKMSLLSISNRSGMIHHSDRGIQYCSHGYVDHLKENRIKISMSSKGNPYDNAIAERVNGILKEEYLLGKKFNSYLEMKRSVKQAIDIYNRERPHMSIGLMTPSEYHSKVKKVA